MARKMRPPHKVDTLAIESALLESLSLTTDQAGLVIVDHGSRRDESNELLLQMVEEFRQRSPFSIIEPAHMEIAPPTIDDAFESCITQKAQFVIVHPYFLFPGRHWNEDIPRLSAAAAHKFGDIPHLVTAPLGLHPQMVDLIHTRIAESLRQAADC